VSVLKQSNRKVKIIWINPFNIFRSQKIKKKEILDRKHKILNLLDKKSPQQGKIYFRGAGELRMGPHQI